MPISKYSYQSSSKETLFTVNGNYRKPQRSKMVEISDPRANISYIYDSKNFMENGPKGLLEQEL